MPPLRRTGLAVVVAAVIAGVSGCGSSSSSTPAGSSSGAGAGRTGVTIQNFAFNPATVSVKFGTVVVWTNQDNTAHTATSDPGAPTSFDTGNISQGNTAVFTFQTPGSYPYHCSIHTYMKGTITVTP
jgi:plastocyanin